MVPGTRLSPVVAFGKLQGTPSLGPSCASKYFISVLPQLRFTCLLTLAKDKTAKYMPFLEDFYTLKG